MRLLDAKTAVITGGTSGIGLATAARFVDEGAWVFITGRRQAQLDEALGQLGDRAKGVRGDVGVVADLDRLYTAVAEAGRGLDIVVANAGVTAVARIEVTSLKTTSTHCSRPTSRVWCSPCKKHFRC